MGYSGLVFSDVDNYHRYFTAHMQLIAAVDTLKSSKEGIENANSKARRSIRDAGESLAEMGGEDLLFAAYLSLSDHFCSRKGEAIQLAIHEEWVVAMQLANDRKPSEWRRAFGGH